MQRFYKIFIFVLFASFIVNCNCAQPQQLGYKKSVDNVDHKIKNPYMASVSLIDIQGRIFCSGTIIKNKKNHKLLVLTADHCVDNGHDVFIITAYDNKMRLMEVAKSDKKRDLALLKSVVKEEHSGPYVKLARNEPDVGDTVWAIGSPHGVDHVVTRGILSKHHHEDGVEYYRTDAAITFGNSGGILMNDSGYLVGVSDYINFEALSIVTDEIELPGLYALSILNGGYFSVALPEIKNFLK